MVVDCGGGTVDITVHEITEDGGKLKELFKASGGPYGSISLTTLYWKCYQISINTHCFFTAVDDAFEEMMSDILGKEFMQDFKRKRPFGFIDLMLAFESRKRSCSPRQLSNINIALPYSLIVFHKEKRGKDVSFHILASLRSMF